MKKLPIYFLLLTLISACCHDDDPDPDPQAVPDCVKALYEPGPAQDTQLLSVQKQVISGESHFWLNNGHMAFDGSEYVINESCDTVCMLCGFCVPPSCNSLYQNGNWEIVWQK